MNTIDETQIRAVNPLEIAKYGESSVMWIGYLSDRRHPFAGMFLNHPVVEVDGQLMLLAQLEKFGNGAIVYNGAQEQIEIPEYVD